MGRPRKIAAIDAGIEAETLPETIVDGELDGTTPPENDESIQDAKVRKKRAPNAQKATKSERIAFATQLEGAHKIVALLTGKHELVISKEESEALSSAITELMSQYTIEVNAKTAAYLQLLSVAGMIYGPRAYLIWAAAKERKEAQKQQPQQKFEEPKSKEPQFEEDTKVHPIANATYELLDELDGLDDLENF